VTRHHAETIAVSTRGRGTIEITDDVQRIVRAAKISTGLCNVFVHHTSASIIVCENADPTVRSDLERFAARLAPDGDAMFEHTAEGPDDMPAHVRAALTQTQLSIPVARGRMALGTWQGIYVFEHRRHPHKRQVALHVIGE